MYFECNDAPRSNLLLLYPGQKNYTCSVCQAQFTTNGSLKRHMSTHSDTRPYMCPYCKKTFKTNVNCRKHMRAPHGGMTADVICREQNLPMSEMTLAPIRLSSQSTTSRSGQRYEYLELKTPAEEQQPQLPQIQHIQSLSTSPQENAPAELFRDSEKQVNSRSVIEKDSSRKEMSQLDRGESQQPLPPSSTHPPNKLVRSFQAT